MRYEDRAEHGLRVIVYFLHRARQLDSARFAAPAGVHLRLAQPRAADTVVRLLTSNTEFWREQAAEPGATLEVDLWLQAGDYVLVLDPRTAAEGTYELTTERIDPYAIPVDAEPNHAPGYAREAPPSLTWSGSRSGYDRDVDAYWLPPLTLPGPVGDPVGVGAGHAAPLLGALQVRLGESATPAALDLPFDAQYYLGIQLGDEGIVFAGKIRCVFRGQIG